MNKERQLEEVRKATTVLFESGDIIELRILGSGKGIVSGYYNDFERLAYDAISYDGDAEGIYVTLNPVNPDLLARSRNRLKNFAKHTTSDSDIVRRRWLPIDLDPLRPAGISSTNAELRAALALAGTISEFLQHVGFPTPITANSGNGAHLLARIDLPNTDHATDRIRQCLEALDARFSDDEIKVDRTTYNAARIWKLYGTKAKKGDHTKERPHRISTVVSAV